MVDIMTVSSDEVARLQATIAALRQQLDEERSAALALRDSEYGDRIAHQSATIDVLKAMAASPSDPQPVFDLIARCAAELCDSRAALYELFDEQMHLVAAHGMDGAMIAGYRQHFPKPPD